MVHFKETALVIEIPCEAGDATAYYASLQKALWGIFWLATSTEEGTQGANDELNWIAAYLGPALADLASEKDQLLTSKSNQGTKSTLKQRIVDGENLTFAVLCERYPELSESALKELISIIRRSNFTQNETSNQA